MSRHNPGAGDPNSEPRSERAEAEPGHTISTIQRFKGACIKAYFPL